MLAIGVPVLTAAVVTYQRQPGAQASWQGLVEDTTIVTLPGLPEGTVRLAVSARGAGPIDVVVCGGREVTQTCAQKSALHADAGTLSGVVEVSLDSERAITVMTTPNKAHVSLVRTTRAVTSGPVRGVVPDPVPTQSEEPSEEPSDEPSDEPTPTPSPEKPTPPPVPPVPSPAALNLEAEVIAASNAERAAQGLPALTTSSCATNQARVRVAQLVIENGFYHLPLDPIVRTCGAGAGENLALGFTDGAGVVDGWMNSPGHRENLLHPSFVSMGVACQLQKGRWLCAAVYLTG